MFLLKIISHKASNTKANKHNSSLKLTSLGANVVLKMLKQKVPKKALWILNTIMQTLYYFTVNAITKEAMTDITLTTVDTTEMR